MTDKYILAIDLGASGPKVALFSTNGEMLGSEFEEVRLQLFDNGGAEQSPDEWWGASDTAVKRLLARADVHRRAGLSRRDEADFGDRRAGQERNRANPRTARVGRSALCGRVRVRFD